MSPIQTQFPAGFWSYSSWPLDVSDFIQSLDPTNIIANGDMESGSPPTGWTASSGALVATDADANTGSQSLRVIRNGAAADLYAFRSFSTSVFAFYLFTGWMKQLSGSQINDRIISSTSTYIAPRTNLLSAPDWTRAEVIFQARAGSSSLRTRVFTTADGQSGLHDDKSARRINLNTQQTLPSADAEIVVNLNFPPTGTWRGQAINIMYRIQGTLESEANYWMVEIYRDTTDTNWDFRLLSIVDGIQTTLASRIGIGEPDALMIVCHGTEHQCFSVSNNIETPLHIVIDSGHALNATGVNVVYSENMQPSRLRARNSSAFDAGLSGTGLAFIDGDSKSDPTGSYGHWDFMLKYLAEEATGKSWSYYNIADAGNVLSSCVSQLSTSLSGLGDTPEPDFALLNVGANDVENPVHIVESTFKNNLRTYVEAVHAKWPTTPIYIALPWREGYDNECDTVAIFISDIASEYIYVHVGMDERTWFKDHPELWLGSGVHYNGAGNRQCALQWADLLFG